MNLPMVAGQPVAQPECLDAEAALLGSMLVDNSAYFAVCRDLLADHFFEPVHGSIYDAIGKLIDRGGAASPLSLKLYFEADERLKEVRGSKYLYDLAALAGARSNTEHYATQIVDAWQRRAFILKMTDTLARMQSFDLDVSAAEMGAELGTACTEILTQGSARGLTRREVLARMVEEVQRPVQADATGLPTLDDRMAGGLHRGRAYGIVGRKKAGKSALGGTISFNLNEAGVPHLNCVLEMGSTSYEQRSTARALEFNALRFLRPETREDTAFIERVAQYAATAPSHVHYLDRPGMTFQELQQQTVYYVHRHKIRGVILDYMQLVRGRKERQTMAEHMDEVSQWLADMCKPNRLNIWVLALAQMNQDNNIRGGEGMRQSFDQVYALCQGRDENTAYMEMWDSRYTPSSNLGTQWAPQFELSMFGPHFREIPIPPKGGEPTPAQQQEDLDLTNDRT